MNNEETKSNGQDYRNNVIKDFVEIEFTNDNGFQKVIETLSRIGIANKFKKELYQSCHVLHKQGKYYIVHFKELFMLDGKNTKIDEEDISRRNTIVSKLEEWGMINVLDKNKSNKPVLDNFSSLYILPYKEKKNWKLVQKYTIGKFSNNLPKSKYKD